MSELQSLPNIGKALDQRLQAIGIQSIGQLNALGSVETVVRLNVHNMEACVNTLYALEGLSGVYAGMIFLRRNGRG